MADERTMGEAPRLNEGARAQMAAALYDRFYAQSMSREDYDKQTASKSDLALANATYDAFYAGRIERPEFNRQVGLTTARGSTRQAITSGMTFGLADEAGAFGGGVASMLFGDGFSAGYDRTLAAQRENMEVYRQNNPYLGRGVEVAGGLLNAPRTLMAEAPSLLRTVGGSAAMGAAAGFGDAEGGLVERAKGAAIGGGLGAGFGALVPLVTRIGGGIITRVARTAGIGDSDETASQLLLKALQDDGLSPQQAAARLTEWQRTGAKPETLFDIGGENTRRLARTAAGRTGPGADEAVRFITERQAGQPGRVADDVAAGLNQGADDFAGRARALQTQRAAEAAPRYEESFRRIVPTEAEVSRLLPAVEDPIGQRALREGMRVLELENVAARLRDPSIAPFDMAAYGVQRGPDGSLTVTNGYRNLRLLDAVKRGYDEIVEGFRDPTSGRLNLNQHGRAVNDARAAYVGNLREMFPRYGGALDAWGGPSQSLDALNRGRSIFTMRDSEAARSTMEAIRNPADAEFFRLGVTQAIQDRINATPDGADVVKRIFGNPQKRALLRAAFPDQRSFDTFVAQMQREAAMFRNGQFVSPNTGSQTAMRGDDAAEFGGLATDVALSAVLPGRSVSGAAGQWFSNQLARTRGLTPDVAQRVSGRLFTSDPAAMAGTLTAAERTAQRNAAGYTAARLREAEMARRLATGVSGGRD